MADAKKDSPPTRIRERRFHGEGSGGGHWQARVRDLAEGEPLPADAQVVEPSVPASDWAPE